ncbi:helix-turn-helix domain-containing protein [Singulisphaera sp. PoT]|uniref:helix-turn-helix domain-containing protein n=1 Tax=Singulisphaera sp. PoT TaxID=3411797 RepID=UPI003BF4D741
MSGPSGEAKRDNGRPVGRPDKARLAPFAALPHSIVEDGRLTDSDIRVLLALIYYARDSDRCWPSVDSIGERCGGKGRTAVKQALKNLRMNGLIDMIGDESRTTHRAIVLLWRGEGVRPEARPDLASKSTSESSSIGATEDDSGGVGIQTTPGRISDHPPVGIPTPNENHVKRKPDRALDGVEDAIEAPPDDPALDECEDSSDWVPPDLDLPFEPARLDPSDRVAVADSFRSLATRRRLAGMDAEENRTLSEQDAHGACLGLSLAGQRRFLAWAREGVEQALSEAFR